MSVARSDALQVIDGLFDLPPEGIDPERLPLPRFGLDASIASWTQLQERIAELQADAAPGELVKLVFVARHGQGTHNLAAEKYGRHAFYSKYAGLRTDGTSTRVYSQAELEGEGLVIGPDPPLTELGEQVRRDQVAKLNTQQARRVNAAWKAEVANGMPAPQSVYVSPLRRAGKTLELSVGDVLPDVQPIVLEHLREGTSSACGRSLTVTGVNVRVDPCCELTLVGLARARTQLARAARRRH